MTDTAEKNDDAESDHLSAAIGKLVIRTGNCTNHEIIQLNCSSYYEIRSF